MLTIFLFVIQLAYSCNVWIMKALFGYHFSFSLFWLLIEVRSKAC